MTASRDDDVYLRHILDCIQDVRMHSGGILESLHEHKVAWDATLRRLQIMAESTTRLSGSIKSQAPHIEWHKIKGFRNVLVHDYLGDVDPVVVRGVITRYLPLLETFCREHIEKNTEEPKHKP
jgi:uncharacterized protein with HEPN domain